MTQTERWNKACFQKLNRVPWDIHGNGKFDPHFILQTPTESIPQPPGLESQSPKREQPEKEPTEEADKEGGSEDTDEEEDDDVEMPSQGWKRSSDDETGQRSQGKRQHVTSNQGETRLPSDISLKEMQLSKRPHVEAVYHVQLKHKIMEIEVATAEEPVENALKDPVIQD